MISQRAGGSLFDSQGKTVHYINSNDLFDARQTEKKRLVGEAKLARQFTDLIGGGKGEYGSKIGRRPQKLPGRTPKVSKRLRVDKGSPYSGSSPDKHLSVDFLHSDIGVLRHSSTHLDLTEMDTAYATALGRAAAARSHGQRDEIQKAFKLIQRQKTGKGLQKLMVGDTVVSDILHRVFNAPMLTHTQDRKAFRCMGQDMHTKFCDQPCMRMGSMLDYALATIRVRDHFEHD